MAEDNMSIETQTANIQAGGAEPQRVDALAMLGPLYEARGTGGFSANALIHEPQTDIAEIPVGSLDNSKPSQSLQTSISPTVEKDQADGDLTDIDFKLYGEGLKEVGVPNDSAIANQESLKARYSSGDQITKAGVRSTITELLAGLSKLGSKQPQPQPIEIDRDR